MRSIKIVSILFLLFLFSCERENDNKTNEEKYVATDVLVKTKGYFSIDKVFEFINSFDHDVEYIAYGIYTSDLPSDSLKYVLNYLNNKTYTNDGKAWFVTGYLHYKTQQITIFPKLFNIKNKDYQIDWLQSMKILKLEEKKYDESSGNVIFFHVPAGKEKEWVEKFKKYDFVEWAELNNIVHINPWP